MTLLDHGYDTDTVMAGILHDIVEDCAVTIEEVRTRFSEKVANIGQANTFDLALDREGRDRDTLSQCLQAGRAASAVKAADILENWDYFSALGQGTLDELFLEKTRLFLERTQDQMRREPIWRYLQSRYREMAT
jgi:hypothetical protein